MMDLDFLPNERRHFVHKKVLGLASKALAFAPVPGAGVASSFLSSLSSRSARRTLRKSVGTAIKFSLPAGTASIIPSVVRAILPAAGGSGGCPPGQFRFNPNVLTGDPGICKPESFRSFGSGAAASAAMLTIPKLPECIWPFRTDPISGECKLFVGDQPGPDGGTQPGGNGAAPGSPGGPPPGRAVLTPAVTPGTRLRCAAGYVLGRDNLCYFGLPRNSKWRKWRPGRRPLFTGGDLNAISRTAKLADRAEEVFKDTNPAKKAVARNYRASWRKPLKR